MSKMRHLGWLTRTDVITLTVLGAGLTAQCVNLLTAAALTAGQWTVPVSMALTACQAWWTAAQWNTLWERTAGDRLAWRIAQASGMRLRPSDVTQGHVDAFPDVLTLRYCIGEQAVALEVTLGEYWRLCLLTALGQPALIGDETLLAIDSCWRQDRAAAVVTAQVLCQPSRVLWLESAEVPW